jgi:hypothetical protein
VKGATDGLVVAISLAATFVVAALTQSPETFTATATVRHGTSSASAEVSVRVDRYASDTERSALIKATRDGGSAGVHKALNGRPDAGYVQLGERRTPIKYAWKTSLPDGQLVTVATAEPMLFLGAGVPQAKPKTGYDVAIAILEVKNSGAGGGELAPAAKLAIDDSGAVRVDDYGATVVWLNKLVRAK